MRRTGLAALALCGALVAGCGVPGEAGRLAAREEALAGAVAEDDAAVRGALGGQAEAWAEMAALVERREFLGTAVGADFVELVRRTAALARRQRELIARGEDDAELNREALGRMRRLWGEVGRYLGE